MTRGAVAVAVTAAVTAVVIAATVGVARGEPDRKRKVVVLEYRAGSSALSGIANRLTTAIGKQTSLEVLGPDQTRAVYGDHLESAIVRCGGEAECVAHIGQKAGAAEVLLVGVSEMGDVILTMQRIDVASHAVSARIADSLASGATPSDEQIAGYLAKLLPPTDFVRFGVIDIVASEAGAAVTVNKEKRGTTPIEPLKLHAPATYDIRVEKTGFEPFSASVRLSPDSEIKLPARLQRPGGGTAWYAHWYVLVPAGLVVAGAAGTTIYFATQKTNDHVPVMGGIN